MDKIGLQEFVGGALQEKFDKSFAKVIDNLQDVNTKWKDKRKIVITIGFSQNEDRDDVDVDVLVVEKLASQAPMKTRLAVGKDLRTGEQYAVEYGKQVKGQMSLDDYSPQQVVDGKAVDTDTGEIIEDSVIDFKKANNG